MCALRTPFFLAIPAMGKAERSMDGEWFDSQTRAFAQTAPRGGLFLLWLHFAFVGPLLVLLRVLRIQPGSTPLSSENACYAAGGYVVEIQSRPVLDYCCFCKTSAGAICKDAAPKALFNAGDKVGRGAVVDVACLRAKDARASDCTATCREMPVRLTAPKSMLG
jgi:hypothetical protein